MKSENSLSPHSPRFSPTRSAVAACFLSFFFLCSFLAFELSLLGPAYVPASLLTLPKSVLPSYSKTPLGDARNDLLTSNATALILQELRQLAGTSSACYHVLTNGTMVLGFPAAGSDNEPFSIPTGTPFTFSLLSIAANGSARCSGGDYYETELAGRHWRSRPPVTDHANGSYSVTILVDSAFPGLYNLTVYRLFGNFHGLDIYPGPFCELNRKVLSLKLRLLSINDTKNPPGLRLCQPSDLHLGSWRGRWTRDWFNESCEPDMDGRFKCLPEEHERCKHPWCDGRVSLLESNGWVYSGHCAFHLWEKEEAWDCLSGKWLFFWGDSNLQDVVRNLFMFVLDYPIPKGTTRSKWELERAVEQFYINPRRLDQAIQVSFVFNGHHEPRRNGLGLDSLRNQAYRDWLISHFNGSSSPDVFVMNSGLHDGQHFRNLQEFVAAVDYAGEFWKNVFARASKQPKLVLRTAVTPAGRSRGMQSNPQKMEVFNTVMAERWKSLGDLHVLDAFDATFPFHFDHNYSDGGHYGRAPNWRLAPWYGKPHKYFVDLMLVHMMLNSICQT